MLPTSLVPGSYTLEVKTNLPSATWELPRDPDQQTLVIAAPQVQHCGAATGKTLTANSPGSLKAALSLAGAHPGAVVVVEGTITLGNGDTLSVPNCTVLQGKDTQASAPHSAPHSRTETRGRGTKMAPAIQNRSEESSTCHV